MISSASLAAFSSAAGISPAGALPLSPLRAGTSGTGAGGAPNALGAPGTAPKPGTMAPGQILPRGSLLNLSV